MTHRIFIFCYLPMSNLCFWFPCFLLALSRSLSACISVVLFDKELGLKKLILHKRLLYNMKCTCRELSTHRNGITFSTVLFKYKTRCSRIYQTFRAKPCHLLADPRRVTWGSLSGFQNQPDIFRRSDPALNSVLASCLNLFLSL